MPSGSVRTRRVLVRLKHSLPADMEILTFMPDTLAEFDEALTRGGLAELVRFLDDRDEETKAPN